MDHAQAQNLDLIIRNRGATATSVRWRDTGCTGVAADPPAAELTPGGTAALVVRLDPLAPGAHALPLRMDAAGGYSLTTPISCEVGALSHDALCVSNYCVTQELIQQVRRVCNVNLTDTSWSAAGAVRPTCMPLSCMND